MEIIYKPIKELTPTEYRACYKASYDWDTGYMKEELKRCKQGHPGWAIMLWDGPVDSETSLLGWAIMTPVREYGLIGVTRWVKQRSRYTAMFWVKRQYRRKGYGTLLMNEVKKRDKNPHVMPHDKVSGELFSKFKCQVMLDDKEHMKRKPLVA